MARSNLAALIIMAAAATSLAWTATPVAADQDPNRPTDKISADLGIDETVFIACFEPVNPDPDKDPDEARQRDNKALLLSCLQAANPSITNDMLDSVMDRHRPEGPIQRN